MRVYRHGDVTIVEVSEEAYQAAKARGQVAPEAASYVLARGEATGSVHALAVEQPDQLEIVQEGETLWLRLMTEGRLTHTSDHEPLTIAPGRYRQVPERERDWFADAVRRVVD